MIQMIMHMSKHYPPEDSCKAVADDFRDYRSSYNFLYYYSLILWLAGAVPAMVKMIVNGRHSDSSIVL